MKMINKRTGSRLKTATVGITSLAVLSAVTFAPSAGAAPLPPAKATTTIDSYVGQSVQVRQDANGNPNSDLADFRWAATQINAEATGGKNASIPLPMSPAPMLRSLTGSSHTPNKTENGVIYDFNDLNGVGTYRTLNLWPQDEQLPVDVKAEFTLNGEKVQAQDVVGKGGVLTATYKITNNTMKDTNVKYTTLGGKQATEKVKTAQPMLAIGQQLIPQSWGQFNSGTGLYGADGRGNYQTQWVGLPFNPLSKDATAEFQWTAVVPEGEGFIPAMNMNIAPIYIPSKDKTPEGGGGASLGPIPGAEQLGAGLGIAGGGAKEFIQGLIDLVLALGAGGKDIKKSMPAAVAKTKDAVAKLEATLEPIFNADIPTLPEVIKTLQDTSADMDKAIAELRKNGASGDTIKEIQGDLNLAATLVGAMQGAFVQPANTALLNSKCANDSPLSSQCLVKYGPNYVLATGSYETVNDNLTKVKDTLADVAKSLPSTVGDIEADVLEGINNTIKGLTTELQDLQIFLTGTLLPQIKGVTDGFGAIVASIQHGIQTIVKEATPAGAEIKTGISEIATGLGVAAPGAKELIATILSMVTAGEKELKQIVGTVNGLKAELTGLLDRAGESPLPYGGGFYTVYQPKDKAQINLDEVSQAILNNNDEVPAKYKAYVKPSNHIFGAYQFMMDPANNNQPDTLPRIIIGIVLLLLAGISLPIIARRRQAKTG